MTDQIANRTGQHINMVWHITNMVHHIAKLTEQIGNVMRRYVNRVKNPRNADVTTLIRSMQCVN